LEAPWALGSDFGRLTGKQEETRVLLAAHRVHFLQNARPAGGFGGTQLSFIVRI
jgi:hypothetical protein